MAKMAQKVRPEKEAMVAELRQRLESAKYVFLADYTRLNMPKTLELRKRLRGTGARMQVVRNSLLTQAARGLSLPSMEAGLQGPTAMVVGSGDAVEAAKTLVEFIKANNQIPALKMGALGDRALTAEEIKTLAAMPARPVLLAQFLGTLSAPMSDLVGVLQQKLASVVYVLKAAQEKREKESAAA